VIYLLAQVAGLLVAVVVIAAITGGSGRSALRLPAAAAVVTLLAASALSQFPVSAKDLNGSRRTYKGTRTVVLLNGCNGGDPTVVRFFSWVRATLPKGARYYYVQSPSLPGDKGCVTLGLLPAIQVEQPAGAQYLVFAGLIPPNWPTTLARGRLTMFAPHYGLVRVS
jgi:hypothetical protein